MIFVSQTEHNKTYLKTKERHHRLAWEENFHHINKHNEEAKGGKHNYTLDLNHLADLVNNFCLQVDRSHLKFFIFLMFHEK